MCDLLGAVEGQAEGRGVGLADVDLDDVTDGGHAPQ